MTSKIHYLYPYNMYSFIALSFRTFFTCRKLFFQAFYFCIVTHCIDGLSQHLNLSDLRQLKINHNYIDILGHAFKVKPSEQNKEWEQIITGSIKHSLDKYPHKLADNNLLKTILKLSLTKPFLENQSFFHLIHDFFIGNIDKIHSLSLSQDLISFYSVQSSHTKQFQLLKKIDTLKGHALKVDTILNKLTRSEFSDIYCKHSLLENYLKQNALKNVSKKCKKTFIQKFMNSSDITKSPSLISSIIKDKSIQTSERVFLSQRYLLSSSYNKETFNLAWESFINLKKNKDLRVKTLEKLTKLHHLDGERFSPTKDSSLILKQYLTHFPEYVHSYLKSCYFYLSGYKDFPQGNPTKNCPELVQEITRMKSLATKPIYFTKIKKNFPNLF